ALRPAIQFLVDSVQNYFGVVEALQQRTGTALLLGRKKVMPPRYRARTLSKPFDAQHLAANWAHELSGCPITASAKQPAQNCCWTFGRDCCCHVTYSTPKICRSTMEHSRKISRLRARNAKRPSGRDVWSFFGMRAYCSLAG